MICLRHLIKLATINMYFYVRVKWMTGSRVPLTHRHQNIFLLFFVYAFCCLCVVSRNWLHFLHSSCVFRFWSNCRQHALLFAIIWYEQNIDGPGFHIDATFLNWQLLTILVSNSNFITLAAKETCTWHGFKNEYIWQPWNTKNSTSTQLSGCFNEEREFS